MNISQTIKTLVILLHSFFLEWLFMMIKKDGKTNNFLEEGNSALAFGDYELNITVPADFIVAATGSLQNPKEVLNKDELARLELAKKTYDKPVLITTQEEAIKKEKIQ